MTILSSVHYYQLSISSLTPQIRPVLGAADAWTWTQAELKAIGTVTLSYGTCHIRAHRDVKPKKCG